MERIFILILFFFSSWKFIIRQALYSLIDKDIDVELGDI